MYDFLMEKLKYNLDEVLVKIAKVLHKLVTTIFNLLICE